ncbi:MAG TPA: DUF2252 domain-containing protein [Methanoregulaceae archaeon]|nr:DUF2252 domain-containing protein [Methanoregulaceae archaeon]
MKKLKHTVKIERDEYGMARFITAYKTAAQRKLEGKNKRNEISRESHAEFEPVSDRTDPVEVIKKSSEGRWKHLIPIRYGRMSKTPFTFLRGSASLMAMDIATTATPDIRVQACGDCHLSNFGLFATPERNLIFDINDFDETLPAPFEWDIKRLATSFYVASLDNRFSEKDCKIATRRCVTAYREAIAAFASMKVLDVWYAKYDIETAIAQAPDAEAKRRRQLMAEKAKSTVTESVFPKITQVIGGKRSIVDQPPLIYHPPHDLKLPEGLIPVFEMYRETLPYERRLLLDRFHIEDLAIKVVGIGSVGTLCGVILLMAEEKDPLILQIKEANLSVLEPYAGKSDFKHHGERVVVGQRLMQSASDMLLGWATGAGKDHRHFYIRQLKDMKFSFDIGMMNSLQLCRYAEVCGWTLARAHARSGDAAMISGYVGKTDVFDRAIGTFARIYAEQTEKDFEVFTGAIESGEIKAEMEQ